MSDRILVSGFEKLQASACTPVSYYKMNTAPLNIKVTNVQCSDTGSGVSICPLVDLAAFAKKSVEAIEKAQTRSDATQCAGPCTPFKLADFDKSRPYNGSSAVFLDGLGRVVPSGPAAVSKVSFDWSFDLRFVGEIGLCLADAQALKTKSAMPTLS